VKHFEAALLEVTEEASADVIVILKRFIEGDDPAVAYSWLTIEAHALEVSMGKTKEMTKRSRQKPLPVVGLDNGLALSLDQAKTRLRILRTMQQAAFKDAIEAEKAKRAPASSAIPTSRGASYAFEKRRPSEPARQRVFVWKDEEKK
jgi:hypothetical protein